MVSGCITTSMQGYADQKAPTQPIKQIATYVAAPEPLGSSIHATVSEEARKRGMNAIDALILLPPTRSYSDAEVRTALSSNGIDGVLILNVGDTGVRREYVGTIFHGQYSESSTYSGTAQTFGGTTDIQLTGTRRGNMSVTATPQHRYHRETVFTARLIEAGSGRTLWVGNGQVRAGGLLFVGDRASANSSVSAIFDDLLQKGIIGRTGA